jgi:D-amino-acid oxidase
MRIAIVGAGVSGLTCGVVLTENGHDVTLFESPLHKAASPVAAAIWYPYHIGREAERWALESYRDFERLADDPATGVSMVDFHVRGEELPAWTRDVPHRRLPDGYAVEVPLIETPIYLPWLRNQLRGRIQQRTIASLSALEDEFDVVVNCTGLGARQLCHDLLLHSGRGVVLRVPNPGIVRHTVSLEGDTLTYIVSRRDDIILGGTDDAIENESVDEPLARSIHRRCLAVDSRLPSQSTIDVGFRPLREQVRLEREPGTRILHNYGHGGAGFTVSWECARAVLRLLESA